MAYDRCVALCQPLHCSTIMKQELCVSLVAGSWLVCCTHTLLHTLHLVQLIFFVDNIIPHFFCDLISLLKLSYSDPSLNELVIFTASGMLFILPLSSFLGLYIHMGTTVLSVSSTKSPFKVSSTYGSHLCGVYTEGHLLVFPCSPHYGTPMTKHTCFCHVSNSYSHA